MSFKLLLKEVRLKKDINQAELANLLGSTQQTISAYENGLRVPSLERLIELAQALDVSLDDLVEFKKIQTKLSEDLIKY